MSKIGEVLTEISTVIHESPAFDNVPIYWDEIELNPNSGHLPCVLFKVNRWTPTADCMKERIVEVRILTKNIERKTAMDELWEFEERLTEILDEANKSRFDFEFTHLGGSELAILTYGKKDKESYKATGTLFSSVVIEYYRLRY